MLLKGKNILLGVAGGIAAYKTVQLARDLTKEGAQVHVLMTEAATRFITPLTFQTLTRQKVYTDIWEPWTEGDQGHISLARKADLAIIAPATADVIAKLAHGFADNVLTTTLLGCPAPLLLAPAMESHMLEHPATQANLKMLVERGAKVVDPGFGMLASGAVGVGRMAEPEQLLAAIRLELARHGDLHGFRLVVTAGGTQEPIDPVRFIGNGSSGQMGYALVQEALERGAKVTLISGPVSLKPPYGCEFVQVRTTQQMLEATRQALYYREGGKVKEEADGLIMAAAVADFRPISTSDHKIKKGERPPVIELTFNPDILKELKDAPGLDKLLRVGFAAETDNIRENALKKLEAKGLDLIVANEAVSSIGQPDNQVTMIERVGHVTELPRMPKNEVARVILDKVVELIRSKR